MDKQTNSVQNHILLELLDKPADIGSSHAADIEQLLQNYPQSGILHALMAKARPEEQVISRAAVYIEPVILHKLVTSAESLATINAEQVITKAQATATVAEPEDYAQAVDEPSNESPNQHAAQDDNNDEVVDFEHEIAQPQPGDQIEAAHEAVHAEEVYPSDPIEEHSLEETVDYGEITEPRQADDESPAAGLTHEEPVISEGDNQPQPEAAEHGDIEDEVFDEIVGIDEINFGSAADHTREEQLTQQPQEPAQADNTKDRKLNLHDEAEKLIVGNIAATDYFIFERAFSEHKQEAASADENNDRQLLGTTEQESGDTAHHDLSKYHDEKMPYSFMWWLDKTRKEHAGVYQPFVSDQRVSKPSDALQHQYVENIFHLTAVEELDRATGHPTIEFDMKRKEDVIIERFIHQEPHINPPSAEKLDTENKAKKSAEDSNNELVTETLARVYSDQMLYHKAIATYKKLMLKFPEKSRYFADQIEQLEKKTN